MKLKVWQIGLIAVFLILSILIAYQSLSYNSKAGKLTNAEALGAITNTQLKGKEITQAEIESGHFNNLKARIEGMSCLSCSDTVFYGLINMKGVVNAEVGEGISCVIYDKNQISRKEILNSELFQSGVYMASTVEDKEINSAEDAKCL